MCYMDLGPQWFGLPVAAPTCDPTPRRALAQAWCPLLTTQAVLRRTSSLTSWASTAWSPLVSDVLWKAVPREAGWRRLPVSRCCSTQ